MSEIPLLLTPEKLVSLQDSGNILLIDLCNPENYRNGHIPGAVYVHPAETQPGQPPAPGHLPAEESLQALIQRIGLTKNHHVVVYDDEGGGWAGRMIWLLDCIGFRQSSLLSGGLLAWSAEGRPLTQDIPATKPGDYEIVMDQTININLKDLIKKVNTGEVKVWDARSQDEFLGRRQTALRNGHIPGASNYEWTRAMDQTDSLKIRDLNTIREELAAEGIEDSKEIVTHCQTHHRSGLTYFLGKALGFRIKAYPGSWSEWGNHPETPVE